MFKATLIAFALLSIGVSLAQANPMRPDPAVKPSVTRSQPIQRAPRLPKLEQILIIGDYRLASFNGGIDVRLGNKISGYTVSEITADYVIVTRNNKQTKLNLDNAGVMVITPVTEEEYSE